MDSLSNAVDKLASVVNASTEATELAVMRSRAAIEKDSVQALRELFQLQKEVSSSLSESAEIMAKNQFVDVAEKARNEDLHQTNSQLSRLLSQKIKEKMNETLRSEKTNEVANDEEMANDNSNEEEV